MEKKQLTPVSPSNYFQWTQKSEDDFFICVNGVFDKFSSCDGYFGEENKRVSTRKVIDIEVQSCRGWMIKTWWFNGSPFGVETIAGRSKSDHHGFFCTNLSLYKEAEKYLLSISGDEILDPIIYNENETIEHISCFYNTHIRDVININENGEKVENKNILKKDDVAEFYFIESRGKSPARVKGKVIRAYDSCLKFGLYIVNVFEWIDSGDVSEKEAEHYKNLIAKNGFFCVKMNADSVFLKIEE